MEKKDLDATLREFLRPPAMTIDEALAADNPVAEIVIRLVDDPSRMTPAERVLWEVTYFLADTDNGGLEQSLANDTGALVPSVARFAALHGPAGLARVMEDVAALFPGGSVAAGRDERAAAAARLSRDELSELTDRIHALRPEIEAALLQFVRSQKDSFQLRPRA